MRKHSLKETETLGWGSKTAVYDPQKCQILDSYTIGPKVLDLGCATALYTKYISNKFQAYGMDWNLPLLKTISRSRVKSIINADALKLPLKDKSINTVVMFDILEHVDESQIIKEVARVAKNRIIITVPRTTDKELKQNFLLFGHHQDTTHLRTYTQTSAQKMLAKHRLKPIIIKPIHPISTIGLLYDVLDSPVLVKKIFRKLTLNLLHPKTFYSNILIVADLKS